MREFSELIKNIDILRGLIREFFVFGYKSRADFDQKSGKTYDNDRRRIQNYFEEYFYGTKDKYGKRNSILIDSESVTSNPLYRLYKAKSFTTNDLILHFLIIDTFQDLQSATAKGFTDYISSEYGVYDLDIETIRLKLNEYVELGVLRTTRQNKILLYSLVDFAGEKDIMNFEFISFFSEIAPLGVIGSFLCNRFPLRSESVIKYKHRLLWPALNGYYMLRMFEGIEKRECLQITKRVDGEDAIVKAVPLKILLNRQNGREYAACYDIENSQFTNCRLDQIVSVDSINRNIPENEIERLKGIVNEKLKNTWNINFYHHNTPQRIELIVYIGEDEPFILTRLQREGHGGSIEYIGYNQYRYRHAVYDPSEMIPWLKSFIGRIISVWIEDETWNASLHKDIQTLISGGDL